MNKRERQAIDKKLKAAAPEPSNAAKASAFLCREMAEWALVDLKMTEQQIEAWFDPRNRDQWLSAFCTWIQTKHINVDFPSND